MVDHWLALFIHRRAPRNKILVAEIVPVAVEKLPISGTIVVVGKVRQIRQCLHFPAFDTTHDRCKLTDEIRSSTRRRIRRQHQQGLLHQLQGAGPIPALGGDMLRTVIFRPEKFSRQNGPVVLGVGIERSGHLEQPPVLSMRGHGGLHEIVEFIQLIQPLLALHRLLQIICQVVALVFRLRQGRFQKTQGVLPVSLRHLLAGGLPLIGEFVRSRGGGDACQVDGQQQGEKMQSVHGSQHNVSRSGNLGDCCKESVMPAVGYRRRVHWRGRGWCRSEIVKALCSQLISGTVSGFK